MATPNMTLALPTVSSTLGPTWATQLNAALTTIDSHDHTSTKGVKVPSLGININADLTFGGYNATTLRSARFNSQTTILSASTDANCLYVAGGDLYYNNGSVGAVQITSGGVLSAASAGAISGLSAPASASYSSVTGTFTWQSTTNVAATMDSGPLVIRDVATNALGITIKSPSPLAGSFVMTLPTALPGADALLSLGASGAMSSFGTVSGNSLTIAGSLTVSTSLTVTTSASITGLTAVGGATVSGGSLSLSSQKIVSLQDPGSPQDAATKHYVDTTFTGAIHTWAAAQTFSASMAANGGITTSGGNLSLGNIGTTIGGITAGPSNFGTNASLPALSLLATGSSRGIINLNQQLDPSSPTSGDIWYDGVTLRIRGVNGVTRIVALV